MSSLVEYKSVEAMAEFRSTTAFVPLSGTNYATWKTRCKMVLMKEGVWRIVTEKARRLHREKKGTLVLPSMLDDVIWL